MPYYRLDFEGHEGEHKAVFAEADDRGEILQQFALTIDSVALGEREIRDVEHYKITTIADAQGKPLRAVAADAGWSRCAPEQWESAVWMKEALFRRDAARAVRAGGQVCGRCGGRGLLARCVGCGGRVAPKGEDRRCPRCGGEMRAAATATLSVPTLSGRALNAAAANACPDCGGSGRIRAGATHSPQNGSPP